MNAAPQERVQFPAYSHLSGRRGAEEKQRGGAPGGRSRAVLLAEAERPRSPGKWRSRLRFLSRRSGGSAAPPPFSEGRVQPRRPAACGPGLSRAPGCGSAWRTRLAEASRALPLLAVPLIAGPGRRVTPACSFGGAHSWSSRKRVGPAPGNTYWEARQSRCPATAGPPSAPTGHLNRNSRMGRTHTLPDDYAGRAV